MVSDAIAEGTEKIVFVALVVPDGTASRLAEAQEHLRQLNLPIRWSLADGLHLTLKYLGSVRSSQIAEISQVVRQSAIASPSLNLQATHLGVFPNWRKPRVLWAGVAGDLDLLGTLQHKLEQSLQTLGFEPEKRQFRPHITLGRPKSLSSAALQNLSRHTKEQSLAAPTWQVTSVALMESLPGPKGRRYVVLQDFTLQG